MPELCVVFEGMLKFLSAFSFFFLPLFFGGFSKKKDEPACLGQLRPALEKIVNHLGLKNEVCQNQDIEVQLTSLSPPRTTFA